MKELGKKEGGRGKLGVFGEGQKYPALFVYVTDVRKAQMGEKSRWGGRWRFSP